MCDYKYQTELKAVIAMDGQMGEVAQSNGRTGKSLVGAALAKYSIRQLSTGEILKTTTITSIRM